MGLTAFIALAEQYGPTVFGLAIKYGPTAVSLVKQYGPTVEAELWPLIEASAAKGTLEQDIGKLVAAATNLAPLLGEIGSLGDVADAIGSIQGAPAESPAMDHAAGHGGVGMDQT